MRLDCLFYTSPATLADFLASETARPLRGDLFVELASLPTLAFAFNLETPAHFPGLAGLLGRLGVADLSLTTNRLSAPFIPAPGGPVAAATLRAALAALRDLPEPPARVTLLVHTDEAADLGAALHTADAFAIAWDAAAHPEESLLSFARWLRSEALLSPAAFGGFFPYTARPLDASAARHAQRLATLFAETAPTVTAAHPALILPGD